MIRNAQRFDLMVKRCMRFAGADKEAYLRSTAIHWVSRLLRPAARAVALAACIALPVTGCIRSKGQLVAIEQASAPLPAGTYYTVAQLNSRTALPSLTGPARVVVRGTGYVVMDPDDRKPIRFHLIRVADAGDVYVLQTDADDKSGHRDILIGVIGKDGFCSKDIHDFPPAAVADHEIVSKVVLLQWLTDQVGAITAMANDVCFIRKS